MLGTAFFPFYNYVHITVEWPFHKIIGMVLRLADLKQLHHQLTLP